MEALYKNTRQQQFCELMETMKGLGFKPAAVARFLDKTPGVVSQYLSGKTNPSETVLSLMRRVVDEHKRPAEGMSAASPFDQLNDLERFSPADYEVAKTTINLLHKKLESAGSSSKLNDVAKRALKKAAASVSRPDPK